MECSHPDCSHLQNGICLVEQRIRMMTANGDYNRMSKIYPGHRYTGCPEYRPRPDPVNCYNCDNADVDPGTLGDRWEPPEPPTCFCQVFDEDGDLMCEISDLYGLGFTQENAARFCPLFRATCANCGKPIASYEDVVVALECSPLPCCSKICAKELEKSVTLWYST